MYKLRIKIGQTRFLKTFKDFEAARQYMRDIQNRYIAAEFKRINF
jgi:hypothetical protein